jgi:hypothetical protein
MSTDLSPPVRGFRFPSWSRCMTPRVHIGWRATRRGGGCGGRGVRCWVRGVDLRIDGRPGDAGLGYGPARQVGRPRPPGQGEGGAPRGPVGRVRHYPARTCPGPLAPGAFRRRDVPGAPGQQDGWAGDQAIATGVHVEHPQPAHLIGAGLRAQECHPAAIRRHSELPGPTQPEPVAAGETTRKGIGTHNGTLPGRNGRNRKMAVRSVHVGQRKRVPLPRERSWTSSGDAGHGGKTGGFRGESE